MRPPSTLSFTSENWTTPQTVTVTGQDDDLKDENIPYLVRLETASDDPLYQELPASVSCVNRDDDQVTPTAFPFAEDFSESTMPGVCWDYYSSGAGRITFGSRAMHMYSSAENVWSLNEAILLVDLSTAEEVTLLFEHERSSTADVDHGDGLEAGDIFTDAHRNADMVAFSDDGVTWCVLTRLYGTESFALDLDAAVEAAEMTLSDAFYIKFQQYDNDPWPWSGRAFDDIMLRVGTPGISVTPHGSLVTSEGGGSVEFTIALEAAPLSDVKITVYTSADTEGIPVPEIVTFTPDNWETPQTVMILGQDDSILDHDIAYNISFIARSDDPGYERIDMESFSLTNIDDEIAKLSVALPAGIAEGETATCVLSLDQPAPRDLNVTLLSGDPDELAVPESVLIEGGATFAIFEVTALTDRIFDDDVSITVTPDYRDWDAVADSIEVLDTSMDIVTPSLLPPARDGMPYAVALEARGGISPYHWAVDDDRIWYEEAVPSAYQGGGEPQGWRSLHTYRGLELPWPFRFYDEEYTTIFVSTHGYLDFEYDQYDYSNTDYELRSNVRVAALWDKLNLTGGDVHVTATEEEVVVRWNGVTYVGSYPVDAEVVLCRSGEIRFNYGVAHEGLSPTIGISAGDYSNYCMASLNGQTTIPEGTSLLFRRVEPLPEGLTLDEESGALDGTPPGPGEYLFVAVLNDTDARTPQASRLFQLEVLPRPELTLELPETTAEDAHTLSATLRMSDPPRRRLDRRTLLERSDRGNRSADDNHRRRNDFGDVRYYDSRRCDLGRPADGSHLGDRRRNLEWRSVVGGRRFAASDPGTGAGNHGRHRKYDLLGGACRSGSLFGRGGRRSGVRLSGGGQRLDRRHVVSIRGADRRSNVLLPCQGAMSDPNRCPRIVDTDLYRRLPERCKRARRHRHKFQPGRSDSFPWGRTLRHLRRGRR